MSTQTKTMHCDKHGEFESTFIDFMNIWTKCSHCVDEMAQAEAEKKEKIRRAELLSRLSKNADIPARFEGATLENYQVHTNAQRSVLDFFSEYAREFSIAAKTGRSAIMVGGVGTGKTHLAIAVAKAVILQEYSAKYTTVQRIVRALKDTWNRQTNETESDIIRRFSQPSLLIIDEVGVQFGSEFEKQILFDVVNERYENRKPTIMLSNVQVNELVGFVGERVIDRMREDGGKVIPFSWGSYRKARAA